MIFISKSHKRIHSSTNLKLWKERKQHYSFLIFSEEIVQQIEIDESDPPSKVIKGYKSFSDYEHKKAKVWLKDAVNGKQIFFDGERRYVFNYSQRGGQIDKDSLLATIKFGSSQE